MMKNGGVTRGRDKVNLDAVRDGLRYGGRVVTLQENSRRSLGSFAAVCIMGALDGGGGGSPMSHVDFKKWQSRLKTSHVSVTYFH